MHADTDIYMQHAAYNDGDEEVQTEEGRPDIDISYLID